MTEQQIEQQKKDACWSIHESKERAAHSAQRVSNIAQSLRQLADVLSTDPGHVKPAASERYGGIVNVVAVEALVADWRDSQDAYQDSKDQGEVLGVTPF